MVGRPLRRVVLFGPSRRACHDPRRHTAGGNGLTRERKRAYNADSLTNPTRGVVVEWRIDDEQFNEVTDKYFDDKDRKLLAQM